MDLDRSPTDRQYGESRKAYQAFRLWLSLRSIRSAAQELGKSRQLLERWSVRWGWVERAEAADRLHNQRIRSIEHLEPIGPSPAELDDLLARSEKRLGRR